MPESTQNIQPRRTDRHIWGIYILLCLISIIELYSASSHEVKATNVYAPVLRHVLFLVIGLGCMLVLQRTHYKYFMKWIWPFAIFSWALMLYTLFFGDYINGARRSFTLLFFAVQPAEMVKLSIVLVIAAELCKSQIKGQLDVSNRGLLWVCIALVIGSGLLFTQGLTNTLLLMAISLSMMLVGGVSLRKFMIVLLVFGVMGGVALVAKIAFDKRDVDPQVQYQEIVIPGTNYVLGVDSLSSGSGRSLTWTARMERHFKSDKWDDTINDKNQQEQYSYLAQAHGGVFGVMPGNSRETARLPLAFSDYIYAIIIEELGLVGGIIVLVLYLWLLARAGRVANRCQTAFPALLVIGMAVFIAFQAIFHMAIVTGVFPVSGQPLPLISKGGTSILITSVALGIMLSVSRFAARKGRRAEIKEELKELPDEMNAENPT